jgi:hypothetical protein
MIVVMSSVLLVYLFQENKSYGNKKPFAFILWCTRKSCQAQLEIKKKKRFFFLSENVEGTPSYRNLNIFECIELRFCSKKIG